MRAVRLGALGRGLETGAVASIVAVFLGFGGALGFAAISIDVGSMLYERRQLQNGADASALSLAITCGTNPAGCGTGGSVAQANTQTGLDSLNNSNASADAKNGLDPSTYVLGQCGRAAGSLAACNPSTGALVDCPGLPTSLAANAAIPYVEVHTQTKTSSGGSILPAWVSRALGFSGETVKACGRAAYGSPSSYSGQAPITFSICEWKWNTNSGATYYTPPLYNGSGSPDRGYGGVGQPPWPLPATTPPATPLVGQEIKIYLQSHGSTGSCPTFNGHDTSGGFGYLTGGCTPSFNVPDWVQVDTGNSYLPCSLDPYYGKVVDLPVFVCMVRELSKPTYLPADASSCTAGTGNNTWYYIQGMAKFYLSGYKTGGSQEAPSLVSGIVPCGGGDRCISGWFIDGILHGATVGGPPGGPTGFGAIAVQPAG